MSFDEDAYDILKDWGERTGDEWDELGGEDQFYSAFPPVESAAEECDRDTETWISPEGRIYLCRTQQHEGLAERLVKHLGVRDPDGRLNRSGDLLIGEGWVKTYWNSVFPPKGFTQRQIDSLFDIFRVLTNKGQSPELCERLRRALGIKPAGQAGVSSSAFGKSGSGDVSPSEVVTEESPVEEIDEDLCSVQVGADEEGAGKRLKPFVLTDQPFLELPARAYQTWDNENGRGISCFRTFVTEVYSDEDDPVASGEEGVQIGAISGGTGYVILADYRRPRLQGGGEYFIRHQDLWRLFQEALERKFPGSWIGEKS